MKNFIPDYIDIAADVCRMDKETTGVWMYQVWMLEDLRDEIEDFASELKTNDQISKLMCEIITNKVTRRIDYLYKMKKMLNRFDICDILK